MAVDLSILILTHKRPKLFKRCVESVLSKYENCSDKFHLEILVNNDSDTTDLIEYKEIKSDLIKYSYFKSDDLSDVYMHLINSAHGEHIYILEDDDILLSSFFDVYYNNRNKDLILGLYYPEYGLKDISKFMFRKESYKFNYFLNNIFNKDYIKFFQLGQIIFKKSIFNTIIKGNYIDNDVYLFKNLNTDTIHLSNKLLYKQTTDGNDNISFNHLNLNNNFILRDIYEY